MKRVRGGVGVTSTSTSEDSVLEVGEPLNKVARFGNRDVTEGSGGAKCYVSSGEVPYELMKCIFSYCTMTCLGNLSRVSKGLYDFLEQYELEVLKNNYNSESCLSPFNTEILPDFKTGNLEIAIILYLYSQRHLDEEICACYKVTFDGVFMFFIEDAPRYEMQVNKFENGYCEILLKNDEYNVKIVLYKGAHVFVLSKLFEKDLMRRVLHPIINEDQKEWICFVLDYLREYKSYRFVSSSIMNVMSKVYQQLKHGKAMNYDLLCYLIAKNVIDFVCVSELINLVIVKFRDLPFDDSTKLDMLKCLNCAMESHCLRLKEDELNLVKDYAVAILQDGDASGLAENRAFDSLCTLMEIYSLALNGDEIELITHSAIKILQGQSDGLEVSGALRSLNVVMGRYLLDLDKYKIDSIKKIVIDILCEEGGSYDHEMINDSISILYYIINGCLLGLHKDDIDAINDGIFSNIRNIEDNCCPELVYSIANILYLFVHKYKLNLSEEDLKGVRCLILFVFESYFGYRIGDDTVYSLGQLLEKYSLNLIESELKMIKDRAVAMLQNPYITKDQVKYETTNILRILQEKYGLKLSENECEIMEKYASRDVEFDFKDQVLHLDFEI